jgi:hypothetical protein
MTISTDVLPPTSSDIITKILGGFAMSAVESNAPPTKAKEREIKFFAWYFP